MNTLDAVEAGKNDLPLKGGFYFVFLIRIR
jgi:hypothetical protein